MAISFDQYLLFVSLVTLIVVTPGPNLFLLLSTIPSSSKLTGFCMTAGFCAAILSHASLALVGVGAIIATSAILFTVLKIAGAAYLIWMGAKALLSLRRIQSMAPEKAQAVSKLRMPDAFARGYLTNILNPKPAMFYVAAFPQFLGAHEPRFLATGGTLGASHALIALLFYGSVVVLIDNVTGFLARPGIARAIKSVSGLALILLGGRLLMTRNPAS